ncbi:uncharacterized protein L3040_004091 [Drepanopeziza brunnea f. sp. 'multigermtubi']|uniref:uncharacterized protein n=1 Tax=Drepanopeziza brunnea f. sp. 'multigermtubi' TaxID=698441 RepID=UPI0023A023A6|nr:hypothetical protein L3040_004091 [Drepanopeziza brunnea f. sp. 'multigermtubi']
MEKMQTVKRMLDPVVISQLAGVSNKDINFISALCLLGAVQYKAGLEPMSRPARIPVYNTSAKTASMQEDRTKAYEEMPVTGSGEERALENKASKSQKAERGAPSISGRTFLSVVALGH